MPGTGASQATPQVQRGRSGETRPLPSSILMMTRCHRRPIVTAGVRMKNRGSRHLWRRAHGPFVRSRATRRARHAVGAGAVLAVGLTLFWSGVAQANAAGPTGVIHMDAVVNANQT